MPSPETSRRNLQKARARWRQPRPWRSYQETRVITRLVWQWFKYQGPRKSSGRAVGRWLGVSHTYIQKLVREFAIDPSNMQREERIYGPATFERLRHAQEETRKEKERGWLRRPRLWKTVEFKVGDNVLRAVVPTKAGAGAVAAHNAVPPDAPAWATGPVSPHYFPVHIRRRRRWRPGMQ